MQYDLLTIGSMTHTLRGKELLDRRGIKSSVRRMPPGSDRDGCTQGLEVAHADMREAVWVLSESGIRVTHIRSGKNDIS